MLAVGASDEALQILPRIGNRAAEVVSWASDPALVQTLEACGFRARYETPMLLRPAADQVLPPQGTLRVQMLDTDLAYLHGASKEFWS